MSSPAFGFFRSSLFLLWLGIVAICFVNTLCIRLRAVERIRSYFQDADVEFTTTPAGALVFINGINYGATPAQRKLRAGTYQIIFQQGAWQIPQEIMVRARERIHASVHFNYATLNFKSKPSGLDVVIDATKIGTTPCIASEVQPGIRAISYRQGTYSLDEAIDVKEGDSLHRNIVFGVEESTIWEGAKMIKTVPEPPAWIGVWMGRADRSSKGKQSKPTVSKLQINDDLQSGTLLEHLGFLPIEVPLSISATGMELDAKGSIQSGDTTYVSDLVLTRIPGEPQANVEIVRHYFYQNTETNSTKSTGILDKVKEGGL